MKTHTFQVTMTENGKLVVDYQGYLANLAIEKEIFALMNNDETEQSPHLSARLLQLFKESAKIRQNFWISLPEGKEGEEGNMLVPLKDVIEVDGKLTTVERERERLKAEKINLKTDLKVRKQLSKELLSRKLPEMTTKEEKKRLKEQIRQSQAELKDQLRLEQANLQEKAELIKQSKGTKERKALRSVVQHIKQSERFSEEIKPLVRLLERSPLIRYLDRLTESVESNAIKEENMQRSANSTNLEPSERSERSEFNKNLIKWIIDQSVAIQKPLTVEQAEKIATNPVILSSYDYGISLTDRFSNLGTFEFFSKHYPEVYGTSGSELQKKWITTTKKFYDSTANLTHKGLGHLVRTRQMRLGLAIFNQGNFDFQAMQNSFEVMLNNEPQVKKGLIQIGVTTPEKLREFSQKLVKEFKAHWTIYTGLEIFLSRLGTDNEFDIFTDNNLMRAVEMVKDLK